MSDPIRPRSSDRPRAFAHLRSPQHPLRVVIAVACALIAAVTVLAITGPSPRMLSYNAAAAAAMISGDPLLSQSARVGSVPAPAAKDLTFTGSTGVQSLVAEGTNRAWAELVLVFGDFPRTEENITVILRWMRQENGVDNWWNRNNPLNNGWGTIEGNFLSGYTTLVDAAEQCADALHSRSGYAGIVAALQDGSSADATAAAIWASDWATGHYDYGGHWSTAPVTVVQAPADAWG